LADLSLELLKRRAGADAGRVSASAAYAGPVVLDDGGAVLGYESLLERDWMLLMDCSTKHANCKREAGYASANLRQGLTSVGPTRIAGPGFK
jgi:hypothetical protein